jgi:aldehyde dehydrogenase (NAD+)
LVAGNSVLLKPAPGTRGVAVAFAKIAFSVGLDSALLTVLPESIEAGQDAIASGVDKVIFTGSSENGRAVLADLALSNTPAVMELSGEDAVLVLADADLDLVERALRFGARLNGGETCIAPRRIIALETVADVLANRLSRVGIELPIDRVATAEEAIQRVNAGKFGLGASIFSHDAANAKRLAAEIRTGFVLINDLIVPTADPRMPFGGLKGSGFGTTRGAEGLLEMTFPHVIALRRGRSHSHFEEPGEQDAQLFAAYLRMVHGEPRSRFQSVSGLFRALVNAVKSRNALS